MSRWVGFRARVVWGGAGVAVAVVVSRLGQEAAAATVPVPVAALCAGTLLCGGFVQQEQGLRWWQW